MDSSSNRLVLEGLICCVSAVSLQQPPSERTMIAKQYSNLPLRYHSAVLMHVSERRYKGAAQQLDGGSNLGAPGVISQLPDLCSLATVMHITGHRSLTPYS